MKEGPNISQTHPSQRRGHGSRTVDVVALGDVIDALALPDSGDDTPTSVLTPYPNSIHPQDLQHWALQDPEQLRAVRYSAKPPRADRNPQPTLPTPHRHAVGESAATPEQG